MAASATTRIRMVRAVPKPRELRDSVTTLIDTGTVALSDGAHVASRHLHRDRNHDTIIGMVEAHPTKPGEAVLRNAGPNDWITALEGKPVVTLPCRRRLGVRTMVIDFGLVKGRISVD